ncbi:MAG TPA: helix-turn-helix domain-containing protein [Thermoanaerobaculia bacterium]|nr:helix-turn-helix domain-containing protein [Thermoanaerobaculia bacterium]
MSSIDDRLTQIIRELISSGITLEQAVEAFEAKYIGVAMLENRGNVTRASQLLGVHRNTIHNKLRSQSRLSGYVAALRPKKSARKTAPATKPARKRPPKR